MTTPVCSSFRDPSGFVFTKDGVFYRQINKVYAKQYQHLQTSGLYKELISKKLLVEHHEPADFPSQQESQQNAFKVIQPVTIPFISYAYEWSFSQLKAAALCTLDIQMTALKYGMSLKDASTYNIQFLGHQPVFIDTLSFDFYEEGQPWIAYRQFCQHFLAPLALMAKVDVRLNQLLRVHLDGIPLDLASNLLINKTRFHFGLGTHLHLHAKAQKRYENAAVTQQTTRKMPKNTLLAFLQHLYTTVQGLSWSPKNTQWAEYYDLTNYTHEGFKHKEKIVSEWIDQVNPQTVWDLGANQGVFSRIASQKKIHTYSFDMDPAAAEKNYLEACQSNDTYCLPLLMDLTNPTSSSGWAHQEWKSLQERGPADLCMALALAHHLALTHHLPFIKIAEYFSKLCHHLLIEFVPPEDSQVEKLTQNNKTHLERYTQQNFEQSFLQYFKPLKSEKILQSGRILYLYEKLY